MLIINLLLTLFATVLLLLVSIFAVQIWLAVFLKVKDKNCSWVTTKYAVIMPAHNEAGGIVNTIRSILPQIKDNGRLVVIADNCSDDTAAIAKKAGAEVIERFNQDLRGKGYALDFGIQHLKKNPPEVVVIIDADCEISSSLLDHVVNLSAATSRPVQPLYLMRAPEGAGIKMQLSEFAWMVRNSVRPLGFANINLPCKLMGSGMAFPWADISTIDLATGHIVEDLKMGLDLSFRGKSPIFTPQALVTSYFPTSQDGQASQRARWEHGHLDVILKEAPNLLLTGIKKMDSHLIALFLDLIVPPLALLALFIVIALPINLAYFYLSHSVLPLVITVVSLVLFFSSVFLAWLKFGRKIISFMGLCSIPIYILQKIPLYIKFLLKRQVEWIRAKRD